MLVYNTNTAINTGWRGYGLLFLETQWKKIFGEIDAFLIDADGDTHVQVEEGADDDTIRFDSAGGEVVTFTAKDTHLNVAITVSSTLRGSGNTTVTGNYTVVASSTLASTTLEATLYDADGENSLKYSATGSRTNWIDLDILQEVPTSKCRKVNR